MKNLSKINSVIKQLIISSLLILGCKASIPDDNFIKECTLRKHYYLIESIVTMSGTKTITTMSGRKVNAYEIFPPLNTYVKDPENLSQVKIISVTCEGKQCIATVTFEPRKIFNEDFRVLEKGLLILSGPILEYKLIFTYDDRQQKWIFDPKL